MDEKHKNDYVPLVSLIEEEVTPVGNRDSTVLLMIWACVLTFLLGCAVGGLGALFTINVGFGLQEFEPHQVFSGGEGSYNVSCTDCAVAIIDRNECVAIATNQVVPLIDIVHNGETIRTNVYTVTDGTGGWVIEGRHVGPIQNDVWDYILNGSRADSCESDPMFTVTFGESGGTVARR